MKLWLLNESRITKFANMIVCDVLWRFDLFRFFRNILECSELFCLFFVEGGKIDESSEKHEKTSNIFKVIEIVQNQWKFWGIFKQHKGKDLEFLDSWASRKVCKSDIRTTFFKQSKSVKTVQAYEVLAQKVVLWGQQCVELTMSDHDWYLGVLLNPYTMAGLLSRKLYWCILDCKKHAHPSELTRVQWQ